MSAETAATAIMCFSDGRGGMEHDAVKLARLLSRNVKVILMCKRGSFIQQIASGKEAFHCEQVGFSSRVYSVSMLLHVRALLRKYGIGNVVFFGASELKTLYFAFLGFDLNLIVRHGTNKNRPKTDWLHRLVYSRVRYHVAISKYLLRNVQFIVPTAPLSEFRIVFPSFEFNDSIQPVKTASDELVVTHVGRIAAGKGQVDAVMACSSLVEANIDFSLNLIGGIEEECENAKLHRVIDQSSYSGRVHLIGYVTDVSDRLAITDVFLFPSCGEGFGNAFIEALQQGIPCIAYTNTVFPEFQDMGFHVTLAEDGNLQDLSHKLLYVVRHLQHEKEKSSGNTEIARKYFNVQRELEDWLEILR